MIDFRVFRSGSVYVSGVDFVFYFFLRWINSSNSNNNNDNIIIYGNNYDIIIIFIMINYNIGGIVLNIWCVLFYLTFLVIWEISIELFIIYKRENRNLVK